MGSDRGGEGTGSCRSFAAVCCVSDRTLLAENAFFRCSRLHRGSVEGRRRLDAARRRDAGDARVHRRQVDDENARGPLAAPRQSHPRVPRRAPRSPFRALSGRGECKPRWSLRTRNRPPSIPRPRPRGRAIGATLAAACFGSRRWAPTASLTPQFPSRSPHRSLEDQLVRSRRKTRRSIVTGMVWRRSSTT
jgi:hypothetical protein